MKRYPYVKFSKNSGGDALNYISYGWLMKTEPTECSIDDVWVMPNHTVGWFGVRNYQARNFMRDDFRIGQPILFYHSSCSEPGIVGIAEVVSRPYPDPLQFDPKSKYYDPRSSLDKPRWQQVDVKVLQKIKKIPLTQLRTIAGCETMKILQKGNRLSITPVSEAEWKSLEPYFEPTL